MKQIFLGVGSNLKNPKSNVLKALKRIQMLKGIFEYRASALYQTSPVTDLLPQPHYINAVCTFKTLLPPFTLFALLEEIEIQGGKVKKDKNAPRILDIDLLLYGDLFLPNPYLTLPHPRMLERLFVLEPLSDLVDEIHIPVAYNEVKSIGLKNQIALLKREKHTAYKIGT